MSALLVVNQAQMASFCRSIEDQRLIAVDTEFFRETTYFAELALVQIAGGGHIACIDVLAFDAREQLAALLLDPETGKIVHSCSQDMEVLYHYFGALPVAILDTQIAAAFLGEADQIGYANLVEQKLGLLLDKSQTRTNWLQRPLSQQQLEYAADDVRYLEQLYAMLRAELDSRARTEWFLQDCATLSTATERFAPDFENCWKRVRGTQRLSGQQLAIVDQIARWRERLAIEKNLTRRKVLRDEAVVELATTPPASQEALADRRLPREIIQQHSAGLYHAIQSGASAPAESWPESPQQRPDAAFKAELKKLQDFVNQQASSLGIAPSMLCSRKELEKLIAGQRELSVLRGWRRSCLGEALLALLGH
jgi:ribonuclease D